MSIEPAIRVDRRQRRREETIEEILEVAVELMAEQGAAGLSLGEVARRMGIRTPSLYGYFDSKNALYDAIFERGWQLLAAEMDRLPDPPTHRADLPAYALAYGEAFVRWSVENPAYTQLMAWRPVPGYEPSAAAYAPSVDVFNRSRAAFTALRDAGVLRPDVDVDEALRMWIVLIAGIISQQLSNAPLEPYEGGTFTSALPVLADMFLTYYGSRPEAANHPKGRKSNARTGRSDR